MPVTACRVADFFLPCLTLTVDYAQSLVKDVPEGRFAHMPHPTMNHPAFCLGHLSLYPDQILRLIARKDLVADRAGYGKLFQAGASCVEQDGRYPPKHEIVNYYLKRHQVVGEALADVPDEQFRMGSPFKDKRKDYFPTIGAVVNYYLNNHHMQHLGQISAWRRAVGLSAVL